MRLPVAAHIFPHVRARDRAGTQWVRALRCTQGYELRWNGAGPGLQRPDRVQAAAPHLLALEQLIMTFRVLGPHERGRFAPEAWGHLLSLNGSGVLNAAELEHLIERAMSQIDGRIALDDLRSLMEGAGFDEDGGSEHPTVH